MIPAEVTLESLSTSLGKRDETIAKLLEVHTLQVVSKVASEAFNGVVAELRLRGIELVEYEEQTEAGPHYRAPLLAEITTRQFVFALDIVVSVGATAP